MIPAPLERKRLPRVLVVAFHFPPFATGSGYQRTLKFCEYLPSFGWEPIVLTAHQRAYASNEVPLTEVEVEHIDIHRAFALDARKHLSFRRRYPGLLALPDRWSSWWLGGLIPGVRLIRRHRPHVVMSTYPIASAHLLGLSLSRLSGLPWLAEFRDPMVEPHYPKGQLKRSVWRRLESWTISRCTRAVFTTQGARDMYEDRYPTPRRENFSVIHNGYDERAFEAASFDRHKRTAAGVRVKLVHSGVLYRDMRDPTCFFQALNELKKERVVTSKSLQVVLRASGSTDYFQVLMAECGIEDIVSLEPGLVHQQALQEMLSADGLILFQGRDANRQIPAKVYEYLRAQRPILALVDGDGEAAQFLRDLNVGSLAQIDRAEEIKCALREFLERIRLGTHEVLSNREMEPYSRLAGTRELARLLDTITKGDSPRDPR